MSLDDQDKISYLHASASESIHLVNDAEVVIVDPPRKGLDRVLLDAILKAENLEQMVYVSCYWKSFVRDLVKLEAAGWKVKKAEGYLFFLEMIT